MFITVINDCADDNAVGRQATRIQALFNQSPSFIGVKSDLEAAGNLIDVIDAAHGQAGIVLVNVAPRGGEGARFANGTPFCAFEVGKTVVYASIAGLTLSLIKKLGVADALEVFDLPTALAEIVKKKLITHEAALQIAATQFRSYEFLPRLAQWRHAGIVVPSVRQSIDTIAEAPRAVWWVDNFGNCKTTLLPDEVNFHAGKRVNLKPLSQDLACYYSLKDAPTTEPALVIGSSGFGNQRFLEIVVRGASAASHATLTAGTALSSAA